ncbi:MAG: hypothetical protein R3A11_08470 [Bdellovibrionota bacterium]
MSRKTEGQFFFESKLLSVHQSSYSSISMILFRLERKFELTSLPDDFFRSSEIYFPPTLEDTRSNFLPMADSSLWHLDQNREIDIFPPVLVVGYHQQQYYVQRCQLSAIQTYPDIDLDCGEISQQFLPGAIVIAHTSKMFHILGIQKSAQRGQYVHLQLLDFFASMPSFPKEKKALMMEWSVLSSGVPSLDSFQLFFVS